MLRADVSPSAASAGVATRPWRLGLAFIPTMLRGAGIARPKRPAALTGGGGGAPTLAARPASRGTPSSAATQVDARRPPQSVARLPSRPGLYEDGPHEDKRHKCKAWAKAYPAAVDEARATDRGDAGERTLHGPRLSGF